MSYPSFYAHSQTEKENRKFETHSVNALIFFQRKQVLFESISTVLPATPQGKYIHLLLGNYVKLSAYKLEKVITRFWTDFLLVYMSHTNYI